MAVVELLISAGEEERGTALYLLLLLLVELLVKPQELSARVVSLPRVTSVLLVWLGLM